MRKVSDERRIYCERSFEIKTTPVYIRTKQFQIGQALEERGEYLSEGKPKVIITYLNIIPIIEQYADLFYITGKQVWEGDYLSNATQLAIDKFQITIEICCPLLCSLYL